MLRPSQRYTRVRVRTVPVLDAAGLVGAWVATLDEVWVDATVRRNEERLRLATQEAQVAVWEYDFVAGQMTRTENHDALYGLPPQVVWTYDCFISATHPDDVPASDRAMPWWWTRSPCRRPRTATRPSSCSRGCWVT